MDYTKTQHSIKQAPALALRQAQAMQNFAPQVDAGTVRAANVRVAAEQHYTTQALAQALSNEMFGGR